MSHIHRPGERIAMYRDQTERQSACPGVTKPSFRCRACGETRGIAGRRARVPGYSRAGYDCAQCAKGAE